MNSRFDELMVSQLNPRLLASYRLASLVASGIVVAVGFLVLLGWLFDIPALRSILPGLATMKANTALAFVLAGLSLWLAHTRRENQRLELIARVCATLTALIGLLTLSEYVFNQDFGIDQLLFRDALTPESAHPGRMSPVTALNFSLLGISLLFLDRSQYRRLMEVFTITALILSVLALLGYAYGVPSLYQFFPYASVAIHTALTFAILCLGILFARLEQGLMRIFSSDDPGGVMARRLMPAALGLPFLLGWVFLAGQRMGLYDSTFRLVLFALSTVIIFAFLIWWNAGLLQSADVVQQQTQAQLGQSEEREAAILYASLDAVITIDHQGRVLEFNPAAQKIFGYDRAQALGQEMSQLIIPPSLREQHRRGLAKYLATGEGPVLGKRLELKGMRADGTEFPVELTITPITGSEQPVFTGFVRDITERKRMEETHSQLSAIVESSDDAIIGKTLDGIITSWNEGAEKVYGYTADEVVGRPISNLIPPELINELPAILNRLRMGESINHYETVRLRKDGQRINVSLTLSPIRDSAGNIVGASTIARDVTESKQAEEQIAYQAYLLENVNDAVIGSDKNSIIRFWNQGAERMFGWKAEEVVGRSGREILRAELINTDREAVLKILAERGRWKGETIQYRKDGTRVIIEASTITLRNKDNSIAGYVSVHRDISERKLADDELRKNAARNQALADISRTLAAVHLDYQNVLDTIAQRMVELIGDLCSIYLLSEDQQWFDLAAVHHPDLEALAFFREMFTNRRSRVDEGLSGRVIQTGQALLLPVTSPEQIKAAINAKFWPLLERFPIHSILVAPLRAQGQVLGVLSMSRTQPGRPYNPEDQSFVQDLADRAALAIANARLYTAMQQLNDKLEQRVIERTAQLQESEEKFSKAFLASPAAVSIASLPDGRYINVNEALAKLTGYSRQELLGHTSAELGLVDPTARAKILEAMRTQGFAHNVEIQIHTKSNQIVEVLTSIEQIELSGRLCLLSVNFDITERKRAEVAVQKAKTELEAANKELEAFSYSVSHDLRAPLRSIDGFSQALLEDYEDQLPAEGRNYLERIRSSAQRMGQLIDDLLGLSRVTRAPLQRRSVNISALAQHIANELKQTHPERQVTFSIAADLLAQGDMQLLRIMLENLIGNAWKFTSKRADASIQIGAQEDGENQIFFIRDNGAGFDMAFVNKMFGAFQRLHAMSEFPGTGIGLATVQRIIHRHGGQIWAEGAVNEGATFFFTLPELKPPKPKIPAREKDSVAQRAKEII